jgi:hypothetical protein
MSTTLWEQQEQKSNQEHRRKDKQLRARIDEEQQLLRNLRDKFVLLLGQQKKHHGKLQRSTLVQLLPHEARDDDNFKTFRDNLVALFSQYLQAHPCDGLAVAMTSDADERDRLIWHVVSLPDKPTVSDTCPLKLIGPPRKFIEPPRKFIKPAPSSTLDPRNSRIDRILCWSPLPNYSRCSRTSRWCVLGCRCK